MEAGNRVHAWTLDWDEEKNELRKMRSKETEADYRYFREPDLLPLDLTQAWLDEILADFPELPLERKARFITEYKLPEYDADILTGERNLSDYFETAVQGYAGDPKKVSNYLMNDILRMLNESGKTANQLQLTPAYLAEILKMVDAGQINTSTGKSICWRKWKTAENPPKASSIKKVLGLVSDDTAIRSRGREDRGSQSQRSGDLPSRQRDPHWLVHRTGHARNAWQSRPQAGNTDFAGVAEEIISTGIVIRGIVQENLKSKTKIIHQPHGNEVYSLIP